MLDAERAGGTGTDQGNVIAHGDVCSGCDLLTPEPRATAVARKFRGPLIGERARAPQSKNAAFEWACHDCSGCNFYRARSLWCGSFAGMPTLATLTAYLDRHLRTREITDYPGAWNGLQIENGGAVTKIAAAVDACEAVIAEAVQCGATLLLVHHGL